MPALEALYYPAWDPPPKWFRSALLFFDKLSVIVPRAAQPDYCETNLRVRDLLPEAFAELREERFDPELSDSQLRSLAAALDEIAESDKEHDDPPWHHRETAALHDAKLTYRIADMLRERRLVYAEQDRFIHTDARVGYLILSLLADRYGTRRGLYTVTDDPFGYSLNVLSTSNADHEVTAENCLATAILSASVPDEIEALSPQNYIELRNRYEPVRAALQAAISDLAQKARFRVIKDPHDFKRRLDDCTASFVKGVEQVKASKLGLSIAGWTSFGIGTMVDVFATALSIVAPFAGLPLTAGWRLVEMGRASSTDSNANEAQRLIARLRAEILEPSLFQRLRRNRWTKRAK